IMAHTVNNSSAMQQHIDRAVEQNIGHVYVTDDVMGNPYDLLPTYWQAEVDYIAQYNTEGCLASTEPTPTPIPSPTSTTIPTVTPTQSPSEPTVTPSPTPVGNCLTATGDFAALSFEPVNWYSVDVYQTAYQWSGELGQYRHAVNHQIDYIAYDGDCVPFAVTGHNFGQLNADGSFVQKTPPDNLPQMSWTTGVAYDSLRNRMLVSTLSGRGVLYGYTPATNNWEMVADLNNIDGTGLAYLRSTDEVFTLNGSVTSHGMIREIVRLDGNGNYLSNITLSQSIPVSREGRVQLVAVDPYLAIIYSIDGMQTVYRVDPATGVIHGNQPPTPTPTPTHTPTPVITLEPRPNCDPAEGEFVALAVDAGQKFTTEYQWFDELSHLRQATYSRVGQIAYDQNCLLFAVKGNGFGAINADNTFVSKAPPDSLPRLSWVNGVGYDSIRQRVLISTFGGSGVLYGYEAATDNWTMIADLDNRDGTGAAHLASRDEIYLIEGVFFSGRLVQTLYRFDGNGAYQSTLTLSRTISVPDGANVQLISADPYLAIIVSSNNTQTVYQIDPATGIVGDSNIPIPPTPPTPPTPEATVPPPPPPPAPPTSGTQIRIGQYRGSSYSTIQAAVQVANLPADGLGSTAISVTYDPLVLSPVACELDPSGLGSGGLCNLTYANDTVRFNLAAPAGTIADFTLALIEFRLIGTNGESSPLTISVDTLTGTSGGVISADVQSGQIDLTDVVPTGDVSCDAQRNVTDGLFILQHTVNNRSNGDCTANSTLDSRECDVSADAACNTTDALFIFQCDVGIANVLCPELERRALARSDTSNIIGVRPDVSIPVTGLALNIPLVIDAPHNPIGSVSVEIYYDETQFTMETCSPRAHTFHACNIDTPGVIYYSWVNADGFSGEFAIADLMFKAVNTTATGQFEITVDEVMQLDGHRLPTQSQSAPMSCNQACAVSAVNLNHVNASRSYTLFWLALFGSALLLTVVIRRRNRA
ncbi:MAG: hypothetical protein ACPG8W_22300, partial [Candidatus Promineifilaceae bacterium]